MNIKDKKPIIILIVTILVLVIGVSLAYFGLTIIGNDTAKKNKIVTGNLELTFTDNDEISLSGVFPGDSITKTITVKNTGSREASYNLVWTELTNEFINDEIIVEATCKNINSSNTEDGTCNSISQKSVSSASNITSNIPVKPGYTQEYTVKITFIDTGKPQNYNKNKSFSGKLGITESSAKTVYCTYDGELTQGAEYVNGQYTYRYKQEVGVSSWSNITSDGWGVQLTDKTSTTPVTSELCTYINDKPIVSMTRMFSNSQATTLDLSSFNTSNITNMISMFDGSTTTEIKGLSNFNTSKVTDMSGMFSGSQAKTLNLTNFDTSNVTSMEAMFAESQATTLDLTSFKTSGVIDMKAMFYGSRATTLNLSSFNTSHVETMEVMFNGTQIETLDLSSFDTSNVIIMNAMFADSGNLKTIYVSDKFNLNNLGDGGGMFTGCTNLVGGAGTIYGNSVEPDFAHIDGGTDNPGYFTDIKYKTSTFSTDSWATIVSSVKNGNNRGYKVGETKTIDMGDYGTHTVRIANTSTPSECRTAGFSQTACGFVLEFADIITNYTMSENSNNIGGWPATSMRTFINNEIYNSLPSELQNAIINTKVVSSYGKKDTENFTSTDKLYLLSIPEIWNNWSSLSSDDCYDTASKLTRTLDYYILKGTTVENSKDAINKDNEVNNRWFIRTAFMDGFCAVNGNEGIAEEDHYLEEGVSPAFRIG